MSVVPRYSFDPGDTALTADPYPTFARLRETDPVHWSDLGYWVISRHADIRSVMMDRTGFGQGDFVRNIQLFYDPDFDVLSNSAYRWLSEVFVMQDPPQHTRVRRLVTGALTAKRVRAMEPRIRAITDWLIDGFIRDGSADIITQFCYRLPVLVMCDMLGIDPGNPQLPQIVDAIGQSFIVFEARRLSESELATANREMDRMDAFFEELFEARRREPRDDLTTALALSGDSADALTPHELTTVATGLFGAGFETTAHMIGNGLLTFARFPDQWTRLCADPEGLAPAAVEEVLRFESSLIGGYRTALADAEVGGQKIKVGQRVLALIGAGNRDPRVFSDPDRFDIGPRAEQHLSFGGGIHFCAGAELARLEGAIAFERLAERLPGLRVDLERPAWREGFLFRGLSRLAARW
ncbi:cytochrome P450 [Sphingobium sp.]|uniref:cytochrome P450 n=1 Tax=Sphingobium sp. TaxID=1912891 RepID=UPI0028BDC780|nr:cytochrome P450 [Sphingobium sp.]